jgi:signal transduction histidine kinase
MTDVQRAGLHHLEQIGMLVLGLTHDFNNTATCLLDELARLEKQLRQLRELVEAAPPAQRSVGAAALDVCERSVQSIASSMQTAVTQTREMQRLYHPDNRARAPDGSDLFEAVRRALALMGGRVRVLAQLRGSQPIRVAVGVQTLVRVLMNLMLNAADAFGPDPRGARVQVRMRVHGDRVTCDVRDNGPGVAPEIRDRLFQPFTTTREEEGGTGLGLSLSRDLIRAEAGELELLETGPQGTTFRLSLPLAAAAPTNPTEAELVASVRPRARSMS